MLDQKTEGEKSTSRKWVESARPKGVMNTVKVFETKKEEKLM